MSPLAQRILNAYDARDRDQLQRAVTDVDKMVERQRLPAPGPTPCLCGNATEHGETCPVHVWTGAVR